MASIGKWLPGAGNPNDSALYCTPAARREAREWRQLSGLSRRLSKFVSFENPFLKFHEQFYASPRRAINRRMDVRLVSCTDIRAGTLLGADKPRSEAT